MVILLTKGHLPNFNHSSFRLNNNSCKGRQLNRTHIILQTGLSDCGALTQSYKGLLIYTNIVHGYLKNPKNSSLDNITTTFTVECRKAPVKPSPRNETTSNSQHDDTPEPNFAVTNETYAPQAMPLLGNNGELLYQKKATEKFI